MGLYCDIHIRKTLNLNVHNHAQSTKQMPVDYPIAQVIKMPIDKKLKPKKK